MPQVIEGNKVPLYRQVASSMLQRIRTGDYRAGHPLPSIRSISDEFQVSVNVVQRAIRVLEHDGLVSSQHGKQVMVTSVNGSQRAALVFGLIHPYAEGMAFGRDVLHYAARAFSERHNLLITVSSDGIASRERERAEHLLDNGVRGLLVWPVASDDNAAYFESLSSRTPVVLVGNRQEGREMDIHVKQVPPLCSTVAAAVREQLAHGRYEPSSLYGDGCVSDKIADALARLKPYIQKRLHYIEAEIDSKQNRIWPAEIVAV